MTHVLTCAASLGLYLLVCVAALLAGHGLLRLLGLKASPRAVGLLAPLAGLALWSVLLSLAAVFRLPIRTVTPWLWLATVLLAGVGLRGLRSVLREAGPLLLLCAVLPVAVMAPWFWHGLSDYQGTAAPDGWAYIAAGQYLWEYSGGQEGGLAPLHQFGAAMETMRQVSFTLLGFLSPLVRAGDTQSVSALLQAWTLFVVACAVAFFWVVAAARTWVVVAATAIATLPGWVSNLIWANNFDNGLALAYVPALAGLLLAPLPRRWLLVGLFTAALLFTYTELAPIGLGAAGLVALPWLWSRRRQWRVGLRGAALAAVVAGALLLPKVGGLSAWMGAQYQASQGDSSGIRPGEFLFSGLLEPRFQPAAFWGLGGEHRVKWGHSLRQAIGAGLSVLLVAGLLAMFQKRRWGLTLATLLLGLGAGYFIVAQRYSYGAYKLILLDWWCLAGCLVCGAELLVTRPRWLGLRLGAAALALSLAVGLVAQGRHPRATGRYCASPNQNRRMADFRSLRNVKRALGDRPLLVAVDEWVAHEWAVYYLRDQPIHLANYRSYLAAEGLAPVMSRARRPALEEVEGILIDSNSEGWRGGPGWRLAWAGGPYQLWKVDAGQWALLSDVRNANGLERVNDHPFFWMGQGETVLEVVAGSAGEVTLSGRFAAGPSVIGTKERRLEVRSGSTRCNLTVRDETPLNLTISVPAGKSTITLLALDRPTVAVLPNGDRRPLVLGLGGVRLGFTPSAGSKPALTRRIPRE
jgi:hypothetical protein